MIARLLELVGGALLALGICLGLLVRFPSRAQHLPEEIASMELAIGIGVFGGVLVLASKVAARFFPD